MNSATHIELRLYERISNWRTVVWFQQLRTREMPPKYRRLVALLVRILNVLLAGGVLMYCLIVGIRGTVTLVSALLIVPAIHEAGHYYYMKKFNIPIEKVGVGVPFGPFKHLQWKTTPRWLNRNKAEGEPSTELWISPLFVFMAYVDEGEEGMKAIKQLPREQRALVYGSGVANNLITALILLAVLQLGSPQVWTSTGGVLMSLAIGTVIVLILSRLRSAYSLKRVTNMLAMTAFTMLGLTAFSVSEPLSVPPAIWLLAGWAMIVILVKYQATVISRWFPVMGLVVTAWLCWEVVPNLVSNLDHATRMGGAGPGETATIIGTRSLLDLIGVANGQVSDHLVNLLGPLLSGLFLALGQSWHFVLVMSLITSVGFAATNLMPVYPADGGHMWGDAIDPGQNRRWLRRVGLFLPSVILAVTLLAIFIRTDFGDLGLAIVGTMAGFALAKRLLVWRLRLIREALTVPLPA